jgi:hypothetical protein
VAFEKNLIFEPINNSRNFKNLRNFLIFYLNGIGIGTQ